MTGITTGGVILLLVLGSMALGLIPATIARRKGRSFGGYWLFGAVFLPFALVVALLLPEEPRRTT